MAAVNQLSPLEKVLEDLKQQAKDLREMVCSGGCDSFEDYRWKTGKLLGLETAYSMLDDALAAGEDDE